MPGIRDIKRRIKSIGSTKKITRAMQMVSAVKMRKAQQAALASRTYSEMAWQIITNLSHKIDPAYHALLAEPAKGGKVAVILVSTNRGFVGGFNANLISTLHKYFEKNNLQLADADLITVGRKGRDAILRQGSHLSAEFEKLERVPKPQELMPISKLIVKEYLKGNYDRIVVAYTHYISIVRQSPAIKILLPFSHDPNANYGLPTNTAQDLPSEYKHFHYDYLFEPDPQKVLDALLPRIIESQIFQAVLESDASEHSSRMVMMKNATDAASDLISDLTFAYNQIRQANITKELAEITAGKIALE